MVPEQPVCANTYVLDSRVPLSTRMLESDTIPPCTTNGMVLLSGLTFSPSSAGLVPSVRIALAGLLSLVINTRLPAAPVSGSGVHFTAAEDAALPVLPG